MTRKVDEMKAASGENQRLSNRIKALEKENDSLKGQLSTVQQDLDASRRELTQQKQTARSLFESFNGQLSGLNHFKDQLERAVQHT